MSAYKSISSNDIVVSPLTVEKSLTFLDSEFSASSVGIDRFSGQNVTASVYWQLSDTFNSSSAAQTGTIKKQYKSLVYRSIRQLYYSNYLTASIYETSDGSFISQGSYGSPIATASFNLDGTVTGLIQSPVYYNYPQSSYLNSQRFFPTGSKITFTSGVPFDGVIGVLSIPSKLYGDKIQPNSFVYETSIGTFTDDGDGNILIGSTKYGDIFYPHGLVVFTKTPSTWSADYPAIDRDVTMSFSSSTTLYETQYKCTLLEDEFNYSQNPTLISGSDNKGILYNQFTSSYFDPYVTTVGLYSEGYELLAVGKLSQPVPTTRNTDMTLMVNLDRL